MPPRKTPRPKQEDIDNAVEELESVIDMNSLSEVDRFFAMDLLMDYGKWSAIANAAWDDIAELGILMRQTTGGKGNNHYRLAKSESISVFKDARSAKTDLAMKISRFVKQGEPEEKESALSAFLKRS